MDLIFCKPKKHLLFWNLWKCTRYEFNLFASNKCSDMHKCKILKLLNNSRSASPIFYKRKRYTKVLFNKMFFPEMGASASRLRGPSGPTPIFWRNFSIEKTVVSRLRL